MPPKASGELGVGGERSKKEALLKRAVCSYGTNLWVETWPPGGRALMYQVGGGVLRLGRRYGASDRDLFVPAL